MDWITLVDENQLDGIIEQSLSNAVKGVILFKHSTRCSISSMVKNRLERDWNFGTELPLYYLDLISYRNISGKIAALFEVEHQSPQILIIKNGKCIYHASHSDISVSAIETFLNS